MDISLVEKSLDDLGIEFTRTGEVLNVKLENKGEDSE